MIKTISTYKKSIPFVSPLTSETCTSYKLNVYVWSGLKASVPASTSYEVTKQNLAGSTGTDKLNVARLLDDFLSVTPNVDASTGLVSHNNQKWCKLSVEYTTSNPNDDDVEQLEETLLIVKGYGYGDEIENPQIPANLIHISGTEYKVTRTTIFGVPIKVGESAPSVEGTIISRPDREIDVSFDEGSTTNSENIIKLINVDLSDTTNDTYVEVEFNSVTITLLIEEECRYTPVNIYFFNKEGAQQNLVFFKKKVDKIDVTKEIFESDSGQPKDGNHQFNDFNVQARTSFKVNSGFVNEDLNDDFKQLVLSTKVYLYNGEDFIPLNVRTASFTYKTRANDRLINYEVEFAYSYNEILNI